MPPCHDRPLSEATLLTQYACPECHHYNCQKYIYITTFDVLFTRRIFLVLIKSIFAFKNNYRLIQVTWTISLINRYFTFLSFSTFFSTLKTPHKDLLQVHSCSVCICVIAYIVWQNHEKGFSNWRRCHQAPASNHNNVRREMQPGRKYHRKPTPFSWKGTLASAEQLTASCHTHSDRIWQ